MPLRFLDALLIEKFRQEGLPGIWCGWPYPQQHHEWLLELGTQPWEMPVLTEMVLGNWLPTLTACCHRVRKLSIQLQVPVCTPSSFITSTRCCGGIVIKAELKRILGFSSPGQTAQSGVWWLWHPLLLGWFSLQILMRLGLQNSKCALNVSLSLKIDIAVVCLQGYYCFLWLHPRPLACPA